MTQRGRAAAAIFWAFGGACWVACAQIEQAEQPQAEARRHRIFDDGAVLVVLAQTRDVRARQEVGRALRRLLAREEELERWVYPMVASYLPPATTIPTAIKLGVHLRRPLSVSPAQVELDIAAPKWRGSSQRMWAALVRGLYLAGFDQCQAHRRGQAPAAPRTYEDLQRWLLYRLQRQGLASYVAAHGAPASLYQGRRQDDFSLFLGRAAAVEQMQAIRDLLRTARDLRDTPKALRRWREQHDEASVLAQTGALMARAIDEGQGRAALVHTVSLGSAAFYSAYQQTRPGALLTFDLPAPPGESTAPPRRAPRQAPGRPPSVSH